MSQSTKAKSQSQIQFSILVGVSIGLLTVFAIAYGADWIEALVRPTTYHWWGLAVFLLAVVGYLKIFPESTPRTKPLIIGILLALLIRLTLWRALVALNWGENVQSALASAILFSAEFIVVLGTGIQLFLSLGEKDRRDEGECSEFWVKEQGYGPTVDILIPTLNEPTFILRRTLLGCRALDYPNFRIFLLDDGNRTEVEMLAQELSCYYIARPTHEHAKAGNLNYAITQTDGELITVFDADFIPTRNFLTRTVGCFRRERVGLVQTHQRFFNHDIVARALGVEHIFPHQVEPSARLSQKIWDGAGGCFCYGSSFLVRRSALAEVGGFVREALIEDYYTAIQLSAHQFDVIYLDESLSGGLVPDEMAGYIAQRQRWGGGTVQGLHFAKSGLWTAGLKPRLRWVHVEALLYWFSGLSRVCYLLLPLITYLFTIVPFRSRFSSFPENIYDLLYFVLPFIVCFFSSHAWLNHRSQSVFWADNFEFIQTFHVTFTSVATLFRPFNKPFRVTPKGLTRDTYGFNWRLAMPLLLAWFSNLAAMGLLIFDPLKRGLPPALIVWPLLNFLTLSIALLCFVERPTPSVRIWVSKTKSITLRSPTASWQGKTIALSEVGVDILLPSPTLLSPDPTVKHYELSVAGLSFPLVVTLLEYERQAEGDRLKLELAPMSLAQEQAWNSLIFCEPNQWQTQRAPGEWQALKIIYQHAFKLIWQLLRRRKGSVYQPSRSITPRETISLK
ncbi:MAG: glycosyltransferase [Cyanobacteria bacterium P01_H01_bin.15]